MNDGTEKKPIGEAGTPIDATAASSLATPTESVAPESEAWLVSRLFFTWAKPLFRRAAYLHKQGRALEHEDLLPLASVDHGKVIGPAFEQAWREQVEKENQENNQQSKNDSDGDDRDTSSKPTPTPQEGSTKKVRGAILSVIGHSFYFAAAIKLLNTGLQFSFPLLLNAILQYIEDSQNGKIADDAPWHEEYKGYWLSAILFFCMASKAVTENAYFHRMFRSGYQARVAISIAVYNKALRLANAERQGTTLGELINLMQVDATKIEMFVPQIHVLWDGLIQIVGYMTILYTLIGWPCFAGLLLMVFAGPIQAVIMKKMFGQNHAMAKFTDTRVKTTNEALQGIQSVKMYTWEQSFENNIYQSRQGELKHLQAIAYLRAFSRSYMSALPGLVAVVSFVVYVYAPTAGTIEDNSTISASTLFAALVAFDQLRFPLLFYPMALAQLAQAKVSATRVETFLEMKEVGGTEVPQLTNGETEEKRGHYVRDENAEQGSIQVTDATVYWSDPKVPIVKKKGVDDSSMALSSRSQSSTVKNATDDDSETESGPKMVYPKAILTNVNLTVNPGELCAVVGRVGSGKSTLCSAVLNETILQQGQVSLHGAVAYAAQSPWILNASLRDNILFGSPMDEEKYNQVIKACQLTYDMELLEDGDLTEIGERGINLSGGQKQRVSVARAAYSSATTVILDDPLSALDPEVGRKLFDECIVKLMKGRTRLFVTNQLQFLQYCDNIVALSGRTVVEQGTFADLNAKDGGEVRRILDDLKKSKQTASSSSSPTDKDKRDNTSSSETAKVEIPDVAVKKPDVPAAPKKEKTGGGGGLVTREERNIGAVSLSVYAKYLKAGGGLCKFFLVYGAFLLSAANLLASVSWVSFWTSDAQYENFSKAFYLSMYALIAVTLGLFTYLRTYLLVQFGIRASEFLHRKLLESVLRAPQSFFDTTPVGRILSRFSKDLYSIDVELSEQLDFFLLCSLQVAVSMGTIIFVTPWFAISVVPLGFMYIRVLNYFRDVSRETKRLESISRSPVYAQFSESLGGLATIRAYGQPVRFMTEFEGKVDHNIRAWYCNKAADRWLSVRLEIIGATVAGLAAVFASNVAARGNENSDFASLAGLSLTFAISLTGLLNWCVRSFAQLESSMNACERVLHYTENIPQEAPSTSKELEDQAASSKDASIADPSAFAVAAKGGKADVMKPDWPDKGDITLNNLKMRYRSDTPLVLKGLSVSILGGQRIGVVGRTGSGKSSLLLSLLRLVEPALDVDANEYEAPLSIDGVDALRIGLRELRSKLGIIPQNPVLFSGTIRSNIDPFDNYSDDQIWAALERCGLKDSVENMPGVLLATVSEYGENLSAGMRQMLVLGRALLRQCRILLLDEATSSVDYETDREIQRTIREAFPNCTVLTVAHRIGTILDSDKILVMKDGLAAEFAPPKELLDDKNSIFSEIVHHAQSDHN